MARGRWRDYALEHMKMFTTWGYLIKQKVWVGYLLLWHISLRCQQLPIVLLCYCWGQLGKIALKARQSERENTNDWWQSCNSLLTMKYWAEKGQNLPMWTHGPPCLLCNWEIMHKIKGQTRNNLNYRNAALNHLEWSHLQCNFIWVAYLSHIYFLFLCILWLNTTNKI